MSEIIVNPPQINQIVIDEEKGSVVADVSITGIINVIAQGPQGPAGAAAYVHQQNSASSTWIINHNLGYKPSVELLDSGSQEVDGDIAHPSINQTIVTMNPATSGMARLT